MLSLTAVTEIGVKSAGTAEPALGYGVGAAGVGDGVGTADDGGDVGVLGDSLADSGAGDGLPGKTAGTSVPDTTADGLAVFSLAAIFDPPPPPAFRPMAPATTAITATAPTTAPAERRCWRRRAPA